MKTQKTLKIISMVYGIIITLIMLMAFGPKLVGLFAENGISEFSEILKSLVHWYDNPIGFFFLYMLGYVVAWFKPLWGAALITLACILFFCFNPTNFAFLVFMIPILGVALLYYFYWKSKR